MSKWGNSSSWAAVSFVQFLLCAHIAFCLATEQMDCLYNFVEVGILAGIIMKWGRAEVQAGVCAAREHLVWLAGWVVLICWQAAAGYVLSLDTDLQR